MQTKQFNLAGEQQTPQYKKPMVEIIEMRMEGILCGSPNANAFDYENGGGLDKW